MKVWRTGDIGIAAALGRIDIGDRFSMLALSQVPKQFMLHSPRSALRISFFDDIVLRYDIKVMG
jgi:hypothetical protein